MARIGPRAVVAVFAIMAFVGGVFLLAEGDPVGAALVMVAGMLLLAVAMAGPRQDGDAKGPGPGG